MSELPSNPVKKTVFLPNKVLLKCEIYLSHMHAYRTVLPSIQYPILLKNGAHKQNEGTKFHSLTQKTRAEYVNIFLKTFLPRNLSILRMLQNLKYILSDLTTTFLHFVAYLCNQGIFSHLIFCKTRLNFHYPRKYVGSEYHHVAGTYVTAYIHKCPEKEAATLHLSSLSVAIISHFGEDMNQTRAQFRSLSS